jgi:hypothetical protein
MEKYICPPWRPGADYGDPNLTKEEEARLMAEIDQMRPLSASQKRHSMKYATHSSRGQCTLTCALPVLARSGSKRPPKHDVRQYSDSADRRRGPGLAYQLPRAVPILPAPSGYEYPAGRPIGSPMVADLSVWSPHAEQLGVRARVKGIEIQYGPQ